jgi:hypothetical protein
MFSVSRPQYCSSSSDAHALLGASDFLEFAAVVVAVALHGHGSGAALAVMSLTAPVVPPCWPSAMPRKTRTLLLALVVIFVLATLTVYFLSLGLTPPPLPLPNPNGYDDFLKAASLLTVGDAFTLDHEALQALVSTNAESLRLLRFGLTRQCALPADSAMTNDWGMLRDFIAMKRLTQLLTAEGRLREMDISSRCPQTRLAADR